MTTEEATHFFYPETLPDTDGEVESLNAIADAYDKDWYDYCTVCGGIVTWNTECPCRDCATRTSPFDTQLKAVSLEEYRMVLQAAEEREAA